MNEYVDIEFCLFVIPVDSYLQLERCWLTKDCVPEAIRRCIWQRGKATLPWLRSWSLQGPASKQTTISAGTPGGSLGLIGRPACDSVRKEEGQERAISLAEVQLRLNTYGLQIDKIKKVTSKKTAPKR